MLAPPNASAEGKDKPTSKPQATAIRPPALDCDELEDAAMEAYTAEDYEKALKQAEAAMKCSGNRKMGVVAGLAACASENADKARYWYKVAPRTKRAQLAHRCLAANIVLDESVPVVEPTKRTAKPASNSGSKAASKAAPESSADTFAALGKDCKALENEGKSEFTVGQYKSALKLLEAAMKCSPKLKLQRLAGMAACRANNLDRARYWAKRVSEPEAPAIMQACDGRL